MGNENGQMKLAFIKLFHFPKDSLTKQFSSRAASYLDYLVYHKTPSVDTQLTNCIQLHGNSAGIAARKSFKAFNQQKKKYIKTPNEIEM